MSGAKLEQLDWDRAVPFRRGLGGKYDRDYVALVQSLAAHREQEAARIAHFLRHESSGNDALSQAADAIERGEHKEKVG